VNRGVLIEVARMMAEGARMQAASANRRGVFDDAGRALRLAAEQISQLGVDDADVQACAELLLKEESEFTSHMAAKDLKTRHYAAYSISHSREPGGRARKRKG